MNKKHRLVRTFCKHFANRFHDFFDFLRLQRKSDKNRTRHASNGPILSVEALEERLAPAVSFNLEVPPSFTNGVNNSLLIKYANNGTSNEPAPLLVLSADNAELWLPTNPAVKDSTLQLLGVSPTGPAGTLTPGSHGTIVVNFTSTGNSAQDIDFTLNRLALGKGLDWASLKDDMQPSHIPDDAWEAVFTNFTDSVGSTTDDFQATLGADASYLGQFGDPTFDVAQLLTYEINKANNAFTVPPLGYSVDAALTVPGPDLTYERWFQAGIANRYEASVLGLEWIDNWDFNARTDAAGNVTIAGGGSSRFFVLQDDSSYVGNWGTMARCPV